MSPPPPHGYPLNSASLTGGRLPSTVLRRPTWAQSQATKFLQSTDGCHLDDIICSLMTSYVKLKKQRHEAHFVCVCVSLLSSCTFALFITIL